MRAALVIGAVFGLWDCAGDETASGYGAAGTVWQLSELNGAAFAATATLTFPEEGRIAGKGPCNRFSGTQAAPYPWFDIEDIAATRMACPDLAAEERFFTALKAMTLIEVATDTLILSNDAGGEMVFRARGRD